MVPLGENKFKNTPLIENIKILQYYSIDYLSMEFCKQQLICWFDVKILFKSMIYVLNQKYVI